MLDTWMSLANSTVNNKWWCCSLISGCDWGEYYDNSKLSSKHTRGKVEGRISSSKGISAKRIKVYDEAKIFSVNRIFNRTSCIFRLNDENRHGDVDASASSFLKLGVRKVVMAIVSQRPKRSWQSQGHLLRKRQRQREGGENSCSHIVLWQPKVTLNQNILHQQVKKCEKLPGRRRQAGEASNEICLILFQLSKCFLMQMILRDINASHLSVRSSSWINFTSKPTSSETFINFSNSFDWKEKILWRFFRVVRSLNCAN